jgi:hypothetical protein
VDPHCFDAVPDPEPDQAQNPDADPDPDPDLGGEGVGQPKMCILPGKILGTPLHICTEYFVNQSTTLSHLMPYNSGSFSHSTLAGLRPGLLLRWTAPPPPRLLELEEPLDASEPEDAESSLFSEPEEAAAAP